MHILTLLSRRPEEYFSSSFIAGSININPVLVRKELADLKRLNFIESKEGKNGGVRLYKTPKDIKLSEIFNLVKGESSILGYSKNTPDQKCPVGRNINTHLGNLYQLLDTKVESVLENITLEEFKNQF